jgi:hypothetical protein
MVVLVGGHLLRALRGVATPPVLRYLTPENTTRTQLCEQPASA